VLAGIVAGVLANYWLLEAWLADRTDPAGSWISDLGSRSESTGWIFDLLDAASGLAILVLAALLWPVLAARSRALRLGLAALAVAGACAVIDGAFPFSCAESLQPGCELSYDAVDIVHTIETFAAIAATIAAFWLLGTGLRGEPGLGSVGVMTLSLGIAWLALTMLMGVASLVDDLESGKGAFQRASQVVLGAWLVVLSTSAMRARLRLRE
jgi:hypothetical protein